MSYQTSSSSDLAAREWLRSYYWGRAAFSSAWVAAAFSLGRNLPVVASILLVAYPAWDALANIADAQRSGGLGRNRSQLLNATVSAITAIAVLVALGRGMNAVLAVFGVWAALAGLFQLITGVRRWKSGAQWAMVLSGAQSAIAGIFFINRASATTIPGIADVAPYAAFGAFYFLVSAVWLTVSLGRKRTA